MMNLLMMACQSAQTGALTAYPLADDGSLAAEFGYDALGTVNPEHTVVNYTYQSPSLGNTAVALPSAATWLTRQAIPLTAGKIIEIQARIDSVSATDFGNLGVAIVFSVDQVPSLSPFIVGADHDSGSGARIFSSGDGFTARSAGIAGFVVGISLNTTTGAIVVRTTDGSFTSSTTFTPGVGAITAYLFASDSGATAAGQTCTMEFFEHGVDYPLAVAGGSVDIIGNLIP